MPGSTKYIWVGRITRLLLITLWVYAAVSKLQNFQRYQYEMQQQVFSEPTATVLSYVIPAIELLAALLLILEATRMPGLFASAGLLLAFTLYSAAILLHLFPRVPCPCGGLISELSWRGHVILNTSLLALNLIALFFTANERRYTGN